jgi:chemotaxis protein histidine kinase CheA
MAKKGRKNPDEPTGDEVLALAIASGHTIKDAAALANLAERTAYRHAAEPAFRARVQAIRSEMMSTAVGQLAAILTTATDALKRNLTCGNPAVEVRSAVAVLEQTLKLREQTEIETRLLALEEQAAAKGKQTS